jgi:hypothetical protein
VTGKDRVRQGVDRPFEFNTGGLEALERRDLMTNPTVTTFIALDTITAPGEAVTLRATATDDFGIRAVSFFLDRNLNGRFDNGQDQPLGDVFTADAGNPGRYSLVVRPNTSWGPTGQVVADAVDVTGIWSAAPLRSVLINVAPLWEVSNFYIRPVGVGSVFIVEAEVARPQFAGAAETQVTGVTFFADRNNNGVWDGSSIDTDLGFVTTPDGSRYSKLVTIDNWVEPRRIVAAAKDSRLLGNPWGSPRVAAPRDGAGGIPFVNSVVITPVDPPQIPGAIVVGEWLRITADVTAASPGIAAITFFADRNNNGRWDTGIDFDLGAQFVGGGPITGVFERLVQVREEIFPSGGFRAIAVAVKDASSRPNDTWSPNRSAYVRVVTPPQISNITTSVTSVPRTQSFFVDFDAPDDFGTRAASVFLDRNNNGLFDPGTDIVGTLVGRIAGSTQNGRWRVSITTTGITTPGTYTLYVAGVDFEGAWGRRATGTIQVT